MEGSSVDTLGLLQKLARGESEAGDALFRAHYPRLRRALRLRLTATVANDEDLIQDTLVKALRNLDRFEYRGEGAFLAWLVTIAVREYSDRIKHGQRQQRDARRNRPLETRTPSGRRLARELPSPDKTPSAHARQREDDERLGQALESLDSSDRQLLVEREILGTDLETLAEERGKTKDAVRMSIRRLKGRLAAWYEENC